MSHDLDTLRIFNQKVVRLEQSALMRRFGEVVPEVTARMEPLSVESTDGPTINLVGRMWSSLDGLDQEEIDAFVLTYRMFTQQNDPISIRSLARIYERAWMPQEAAAPFADAREQLNSYLESYCTVMIGEGHIQVKQLLDVFLYGGLAHNNREKVRQFRAWMDDGGVTGFLWAEFVVALKEMMRFLSYFKILNEAVLTKIAA